VLQGERKMAGDNRPLGQFNLDGIPPAPRGVPQIEVTFDIDANGIVHVSAKDKATSKEQSIQITASSGLSETDVDRLVKEAEAASKDDDAKRQVAELKNTLDALKYQVEKQLKEHGGKLDEPDRKDLEQAVADAGEALKTADKDQLEKAKDNLERKAHKLAEKIYKTQGGGADAGAGAQPNPKKGGNDDVIDAEFDTK